MSGLPASRKGKKMDSETIGNREDFNTPMASSPSFWDSIGAGIQNAISSAADVWRVKQGVVSAEQASVTAGAVEAAKTQKTMTTFIWIASFVFVIALVSVGFRRFAR
jgi:hypothetical protein